MTYSDLISKRIYELILERNITINKLATLSGITQSTLSSIMIGKSKNITIKTIHRICIGLDITLSEFFDFQEMNTTKFDDE